MIKGYVEFSKLQDRSLREFIRLLNSHEKFLQRDLKIVDLLFGENQESVLGSHGIYLFYSPDNEPLYVGKCSQRNFVERIPLHFAMHAESWMNTFLKKYKEQFKIDGFADAMRAALNCSLLLISMEYSFGNKIGRMERILQS